MEGDYPYEVYYANRDVHGVWSPPENVSNSSTSSAYPCLAVEESGIVHVVWYEVENLKSIMPAGDTSGLWSAPINISDTPYVSYDSENRSG